MLKECTNCGSVFNKTWKKTDVEGQYICPACGAFWIDTKKIKDENKILFEEKIKSIPPLLERLTFKEAEEKLEILRDEFPKESRVWFYSALASNCISYIDDDYIKGRKIPTLNNISFTPLFETEFVKKSLQYASEIEAKEYNRTFEYIETKRREIEDDFNNARYQYDVFISCKVSKLNEETKEPILDDEGEVKKTADYKIANDLYYLLKNKFPGIRVFFSEREKENFIGQRYENYIFSALHTSKIFILVGESRFNLDWKWVRNEWKRFLNLMSPSEPNHENRKFILVSKSLNPSDLPPEIKNREYLNLKTTGSELSLYEWIKKELYKEEVKKIQEKSFDNVIDVENIKLSEATALEKGTLNRNISVAKESVIEELNAQLYRLKNPATREDAKHQIARLSMENPDVYELRLHVLLNDYPFDDFDDYFRVLGNINKYSDFAKIYFANAKEEDAIANIKLTVREIIDRLQELFIINNHFSANTASLVSNAFNLIVKPYLSYFSKDFTTSLLEEYNTCIHRIIMSFEKKYDNSENSLQEKAEFEKEFHKIIKDYLQLRQFINENDPKDYIYSREEIISLDINDEFALSLNQEILDIDNNNPKATWLKLLTILVPNEWKLVNSYSHNGKYIDLIFDENKLTEVAPVVGNKTIIDLFKSLFDYSSSEEKPFYLYAFLMFVINDKNAFIHDEANKSNIAVSKGSEDELLNVVDLFNKYITYKLSSNYNPDVLLINENNIMNWLNPTYNAYKLVTDTTARNSLMCRFAINLLNQSLFNEAVIIFDLYLAQQKSIKSLDSLMIRYYKEMAIIRCKNYNEAKHALSTINIDRIVIDIIGQKNEIKCSKELINNIEDVKIYQSNYRRRFDEIKSIIVTAPDFTFENKDQLNEVVKKINEMLLEASKSNSEIGKELTEIFTSEIELLKKNTIQAIYNYFYNNINSIINEERQYCIENINKLEESVVEIENLLNEAQSINKSIAELLNKNLSSSINEFKEKIDNLKDREKQLSILLEPKVYKTYFKLMKDNKKDVSTIEFKLSNYKAYIKESVLPDNALKYSKSLEILIKVFYVRRILQYVIVGLFALVDVIAVIAIFNIFDNYLDFYPKLINNEINVTQFMGNTFGVTLGEIFKSFILPVLWLVFGNIKTVKNNKMLIRVIIHKVITWLCFALFILLTFTTIRAMIIFDVSGTITPILFLLIPALLMLLISLKKFIYLDKNKGARAYGDVANVYLEKKQYSKAYKYINKGIKAKDDDCKCLLGKCYHYGYGVEKNSKKALDLYMEAYNNGNVLATYQLGMLYEFGSVYVEKDLNKALSYYKQIVDVYVPAKFRVGWFYDSGVAGVVDKKQAVENYIIAADNGNKFAQYNLALIYYNIDNKELFDYEKAFKYFMLAAKQSHAEAQNYVGLCYHYGRGVKKSKTSAQKWYRKSIRNGGKYALSNLEKL